MTAQPEVPDFDDYFPHPIPTHPRPATPAYVGIHIAYHVLNDRLEASLAPRGISPSEAVVLRAVRREPGAAIAVIRRAAGLKRTTLSSLLRRLERGGYISRDRSTWDGRSAALDLTAHGRTAALGAEDVFATVDAELAMWIARSRLDTAMAIAEAARALGRPADEIDY